MSEVAIRTPSDLASLLISEERTQQYAMALPDGVDPERFARGLKTALISQPSLVDADRASLYLALLHAAQVGLLPDGRQGAIVVYGKKAQFLPMIGGVRDVLADYGWMLQTSVVYEADEFDFDEARQLVSHRPPRVGSPRGEIQGAYAQATHKDGRRMAEVMSLAEIHAVRDKAKAASNPAWKDPQSYPRMVEKTPGHRLAKKLPLDPKDRERVDRIVASELEPGASAEVLYGREDSPSSAGTGASAGGPPAGETGGRAPAEPDLLPAAGEPEDEPGIETGELTEDDLQALADGVADYVPPTGKFSADGQYGPKTLAEIAALGPDGAKWFVWALSKLTGPEEYVAAVTSYARVYMVAQYSEALAKRELS